MPRNGHPVICMLTRNCVVVMLAFALFGACVIGPKADQSPQPSATASVAAPAPQRAVGTVEANQPEQTLAGFGAAIAYYQDWAAKSPYKNEIYKALFKDLNLSILRLRDTYSDPKDNLAHVAQDAAIARDASAALGRPLQIMLCSWSPPASIKSNHDTKNGGTLIQVNGAFAYDQFAQFWADSLAAYAKDGVKPTYVSIQNEPDYKAAWESCLFTPKEGDVRNGTTCAGYSQALDAVYHKFQAMSDPPKLIGPETIGIGYGDPENYIPPTDTGVMSELWGLSHHLYHGGDQNNPDSFVPRLNAIRSEYGDKPKMMTEFDRGDMFQTAWLINNCLTEENAAAYVYWGGVWPHDPGLVLVENPDQQSQWKNPHGWKLGDIYYAMKHFSWFTAPGYRRVDTSSSNPGVKMSAFLSPDRRRLSVVVLNTSQNQPADFELKLNGYSSRKTLIYQTTAADRFKKLGGMPKNNHLSLPPRSITTIAFG
ncbi:MAG TPA: glycoside hydrolase family 30 beta sandwich domain-containing protein [Capsulimonadaceae bacterium]|nr:glycoside hydrolase family 30 beta sandwich domain-containing protein [Capsulimonadaceae bacterium]